MRRRLLLALLAFLAHPCTNADLLVIVNRQNPLDSLSENEVRKIFLGRIRLYPHTTREIVSFDLEARAPSRQFFYQTLMNMDAAQLSSYRASYLFSGKGRIPETTDTEAELLQAVGADAQAIGYVTEDSLASSPQRDAVKVVFRLGWPGSDAPASAAAAAAEPVPQDALPIR